MRTNDTIQRFIFEHADIRGEIIHLEQTYQTIINQRDYPDDVQKLLGEALLCCILLTASIKFEGEISLQFQGDERLPLLLVQCDHQQQVRAFAKYKPQHGINYLDAFLKGKMVLTINQYQKTQSYQSIIPIQSEFMSENIMHYFAQSEQISTQVWLATNATHASGILLQLMPGQDSKKREEFWEYAVHIGQTITEKELLTLDTPTILHRLYHETELRLYPVKPIRFQCRCSHEKMQRVLTTLGQDEIEQLLKERDSVEVVCDFCNQEYKFDTIDIALLFHQS